MFGTPCLVCATSAFSIELLLEKTVEEALTAGYDGHRYIHMLQRCDDGVCRELVRARTTWRPA